MDESFSQATQLLSAAICDRKHSALDGQSNHLSVRLHRKVSLFPILPAFASGQSERRPTADNVLLPTIKAHFNVVTNLQGHPMRTRRLQTKGKSNKANIALSHRTGADKGEGLASTSSDRANFMRRKAD